MANLDQFDGAEMRAAYAGLFEALWRHMDEVETILISFSYNSDFKFRSCSKGFVINCVKLFVRVLRAKQQKNGGTTF